MTQPSGTALAPAATAAGRPQPQTTSEPAGGPFVRHAPKGRRPIYSQPATFGTFFGPPMVSSPGWNAGFRLSMFPTTAGSANGVIASTGAFTDVPQSVVQLLQMKDAWGTNLLAGPGWEMLQLVQMLSGQFGIDNTRSPQNLPSWTGVTANSTLFSTVPTGYGTTVQVANEADFYWLPNVSVDPPGIGTTCQYIFQPCNPPLPSGSTLRIQLPRLGGYLTVVGVEIRDSTNARVDAWPTAQATGAAAGRLQIYQDGVAIYDTDMGTFFDDLAIQMGWGAGVGGSQTAAPTVTAMPRPTGVIALNRKTSLAQKDFGLFDTGETFMSTNPGTQLELGFSPAATISNTPATVSAVIGQVVPTGALIQGLPEI
jgi:hypothetical protein